MQCRPRERERSGGEGRGEEERRGEKRVALMAMVAPELGKVYLELYTDLAHGGAMVVVVRPECSWAL